VHLVSHWGFWGNMEGLPLSGEKRLITWRYCFSMSKTERSGTGDMSLAAKVRVFV
jgi:hypothetical protein